MPELHPFRALRYAADAVPDLGAVLCPPYDVISPDEREHLAARDPRNAVHVELPVSGPRTTSPYEAAAQQLTDWIADGTLRRDDRPHVYVYEQRHRVDDGEVVARGLFCRLRLEHYGSTSGVRPHEATMSGPKEDRFRLLSAVRTNLSPVLLLYESDDRGSTSADLIDGLASSPPVAEAIGPGGVAQRLWMADPDNDVRARDLLHLAGENPLTIADGHHRYETALRYHDEGGAGPDSAFVLALLYDAASGGLSLLPWHRIIGGLSDPEALLASAADLFSLSECGTAADLIRAMAAATSGTIGVWTRGGGGLLSVERERVAQWLPADGSEALRWLDVSVLSGTLGPMTGSTTQELVADARLTFLSDAAAAVGAVESGAADAVFLLRPTPIDAVLAVAAAGEHMPAKSTYFHPKAATGIVFNPVF